MLSAVQTAENDLCYSAIDVVQVQDMTCSFDELWVKMAAQVENVVRMVANTHVDSRFGLVTFGDKNLTALNDVNNASQEPYALGTATDYCLHVDMPLSKPDPVATGKLFASFRNNAGGGGGDWSEGVFEALYRTLLTHKVNWRPRTLSDGSKVSRVVVLVTDAMTHLAGDVKKYLNQTVPEFSTIRNDLRFSDDENFGCDRVDYPYIQEVVDLLKEEDINLFLLVAPGGIYKENNFVNAREVIEARIPSHPDRVYHGVHGLGNWYKDIAHHYGLRDVYVGHLDDGMAAYFDVFRSVLRLFQDVRCGITSTTTMAPMQLPVIIDGGTHVVQNQLIKDSVEHQNRDQSPASVLTRTSERTASKDQVTATIGRQISPLVTQRETVVTYKSAGSQESFSSMKTVTPFSVPTTVVTYTSKPIGVPVSNTRTVLTAVNDKDSSLEVHSTHSLPTKNRALAMEEKLETTVSPMRLTHSFQAAPPLCVSTVGQPTATGVATAGPMALAQSAVGVISVSSAITVLKNASNISSMFMSTLPAATKQLATVTRVSPNTTAPLNGRINSTSAVAVLSRTATNSAQTLTTEFNATWPLLISKRVKQFLSEQLPVPLDTSQTSSAGQPATSNSMLFQAHKSAVSFATECSGLRNASLGTSTSENRETLVRRIPAVTHPKTKCGRARNAEVSSSISNVSISSTESTFRQSKGTEILPVTPRTVREEMSIGLLKGINNKTKISTPSNNSVYCVNGPKGRSSEGFDVDFNALKNSIRERTHQEGHKFQQSKATEVLPITFRVAPQKMSTGFIEGNNNPEVSALSHNWTARVDGPNVRCPKEHDVDSKALEKKAGGLNHKEGAHPTLRHSRFIQEQIKDQSKEKHQVRRTDCNAPNKKRSSTGRSNEIPEAVLRGCGHNDKKKKKKECGACCGPQSESTDIEVVVHLEF